MDVCLSLSEAQLAGQVELQVELHCQPTLVPPKGRPGCCRKQITLTRARAWGYFAMYWTDQ